MAGIDKGTGCTVCTARHSRDGKGTADMGKSTAAVGKGTAGVGNGKNNTGKGKASVGNGTAGREEINDN